MSKLVGGSTTTEAWDLAGGLPLMLEDKNSSATTDYVCGPGGLPLEQIVGSTTLWYGHDHLGSTRVVTGSSGTVQASYAYDAYGNLLSTTGSLTNQPYRFAGQYQDSESGFYYLRARYYDPTTAQFLSRDPMEATTRSPYAYATNDPTTLKDPSGQDPWWNDAATIPCTGDPITDAENGHADACEGSDAAESAEANAAQQWAACNRNYNLCDNALKAALAVCGYTPGLPGELCKAGARARDILIAIGHYGAAAAANCATIAGHVGDVLGAIGSKANGAYNGFQQALDNGFTF
jgi:RHS repeat-associated protein